MLFSGFGTYSSLCEVGTGDASSLTAFVSFDLFLFFLLIHITRKYYEQKNVYYSYMPKIFLEFSVAMLISSCVSIPLREAINSAV